MTRIIPVMAAVLASLALSAAPAFAKDHGNGHGNGNGKGQDKQEERAEGRGDGANRGERHEVKPGAYFNERQRELAHRSYVEHYGNAKRCPPGLAKKNNGCLPPGQARRWSVGEPIPSGVVLYPVPQPVLVQLPPPPIGYRYSRAGGDVVLIRINGNVVADVLLNIFG